MEKNEATIWAENVAQHMIESRNKKEFLCEGMWSPSGFFHIGNARAEIFTPFSVARALRDKGVKAAQNFIIDDFDGIRKVPEGLVKKEKEKEFLGIPYALAPSPIKGFDSWKDAFAKEAVETIPEFGVKLKVYSAYELYKEGKFNELIIKSLNNAEKITNVWKSIAKADKEEGFLPIQMLCTQCSRNLSTKALFWDGKEVEFECRECNFKGKNNPLNGNAKLHWRVHWVAHWVLFNVDFESGGKDHFTKGGSVEMGHALAKEVFKINPPYQVPTEFIQMKGKKMSGSLGNVINLREWLNVSGAEEFRYLNFSYKSQSVIDFSLDDNSFILLNENFERAKRIYYGLEDARDEKLTKKIKKEFELSSIELEKEMPSEISYKYAVMLSQLIDEEKEFDKLERILREAGHIPEKKLNEKEIMKIKKKIKRARYWVEKYAPEFKTEFAKKIPEEFKAVKEEVKNTIKEIGNGLDKAKNSDEIQEIVYNKGKENGLDLKELFKAIYLLLIGKSQGPKIGTLISALGKDKVKERMSKLA